MRNTAAACSTRRTSWSASPIIRLPFGSGQRWLHEGVGNALAGGWTVSFVIQMQSGFPIGVSQNTNNTNLLGAGQRPNVVPGVDPKVRRQHHGSPAATIRTTTST